MNLPNESLHRAASILGDAIDALVAVEDISSEVTGPDPRIVAIRANVEQARISAMLARQQVLRQLTPADAG